MYVTSRSRIKWGYSKMTNHSSRQRDAACSDATSHEKRGVWKDDFHPGSSPELIYHEATAPDTMPISDPNEKYLLGGYYEDRPMWQKMAVLVVVCFLSPWGATTAAICCPHCRASWRRTCISTTRSMASSSPSSRLSTASCRCWPASTLTEWG